MERMTKGEGMTPEEYIAMVEKENKKLKEEIKSRQEEVERFKTNAMQDMTEITELEIENKKLKERIKLLDNENMCLNAEIKDREEENKKLKEAIKDHQLYEEKLEHRIIEFEELLHGE